MKKIFLFLFILLFIPRNIVFAVEQQKNILKCELYNTGLVFNCIDRSILIDLEHYDTASLNNFLEKEVPNFNQKFCKLTSFNINTTPHIYYQLEYRCEYNGFKMPFYLTVIYDEGKVMYMGNLDDFKIPTMSIKSSDISTNKIERAKNESAKLAPAWYNTEYSLLKQIINMSIKNNEVILEAQSHYKSSLMLLYYIINTHMALKANQEVKELVSEEVLVDTTNASFPQLSEYFKKKLVNFTDLALELRYVNQSNYNTYEITYELKYKDFYLDYFITAYIKDGKLISYCNNINKELDDLNIKKRIDLISSKKIKFISDNAIIDINSQFQLKKPCIIEKRLDDNFSPYILILVYYEIENIDYIKEFVYYI